jgi:hypothetical protein
MTGKQRNGANNRKDTCKQEHHALFAKGEGLIRFF